MKITAVVVTYNRLKLLKHGLECLGKQKQLSEIIVVNNGSTDGTTEWLDKKTGCPNPSHGCPNPSPSPREGMSNHINKDNDSRFQVSIPPLVREGLGRSSDSHVSKHPPLGGGLEGMLIVINQTNVGGSGGFYTGIKAAYDRGADWIWCMDDDVFPRPDCLDSLLEHIGEPDAGILSPRRILDGKVFTHEFRHFNFTNPLASMHGGKLNPLHSEGLEEAVAIAGCDFEGPFISRQVVETIGLPNKDLFIFCDDTDYCLRAHLAEFKLYYIPDALMDKHKFFSDDTWTTRNQKKKWKRYYQLRNETYMNHHYGRNSAVRYLRGLLGLLGYCIPALLSMPFTKAWTMHDLAVLWQAYKDGIAERLGKRQQ